MSIPANRLPRGSAVASLLATLVLGACTTDGGLASADEVKQRYQAAVAKAQADRASSTPPAEVEGLFKRHPISDSRNPQTWPRVAITITSATPGVLSTVSLGQYNNLKPTDCIVYDLKVWASASAGKSYPGLKLCSAELYQRVKAVPMYQIEPWGRRSFFVTDKTTGSVRTEGPVPPRDHFPTDAALQNLWLDRFKNSMAYMGGVLVILGYDWNDVQDKRVWVVSAPAKPTPAEP